MSDAVSELGQLLRSKATQLGREHGRATASWYFDGNTEPETYVKVQRGIDDGDPEVLDTFPSNPLSGEWADSMTPAKLYEELGANDDVNVEDYCKAYGDSLCTAYEDAFNSAVESTIAHACQQQLQG